LPFRARSDAPLARTLSRKRRSDFFHFLLVRSRQLFIIPFQLTTDGKAASAGHTLGVHHSYCKEAVMMLNFVQHLFDRGRTLHQLGLAPQATRAYKRVASCRALPAEVAQETQRHLAELYLDQGHYRLARRALAAALAHEPQEAYYHFLMGACVLEDPQAQPHRALTHLRAALKLDPDNAEYQVEFGLLALALDMPRLALTALRRAATLAPDDPALLGRVADGLRDLGKPDEAQGLLRAAMFGHPRDQRFRNLWQRYQFQTLHAEQQQARARWATVEDAPAILPFTRPEGGIRMGSRRIRTDGPSTTPAPKLFPVRATSRKKAT
jgi:tetratricopeptide (TPR) repeat protein